MPKDRRVNSSSFDQARVSPYAGSSKISDPMNSERYLPHVGDEAEWEEARCPICMDHPHNAVLLICSSHDCGCRPYMCDTSSRHSNCLDQFHKSSSASSTPVATSREDVSAPRAAPRRHRGEQPLSRPINSLEGQQPVFVCPLCRGQITGWLAIEPARRFMNSKLRICSSENCNFSGNYSELRKHARLEHPSDRPAEANTQRQSEWMRLERQRDLEDALALSAYQPDLDYDWGDLDELPSFDEWDEDGLWSDWNLFDFPTGLSADEDELSEDNNIFTSNLEVEFSFSFLDYLLSYPEIDATDSGTAISNDRVRDRRQRSSRSNYPIGDSSTGSRSRSNYHSHRENVQLNSRLSYEGNAPASSRSTYLRTRSRSGSGSGSRSRSSFHRTNRPPLRPNTSGRQMPGSSQWHQPSRRS